MNADELVDIVNESLTKSEQVKILKKTETSSLASQFNYADIDDNSDNVSEISEIEEEKRLIVLNCQSLISHLRSKVKK